MYNKLLNVLVFWEMLFIKRFFLPSLIKQTHTPETVQKEALQRILSKNQNTRFGKEHNFGSIKSSDQFKEAIPIQNWEDLRPYIEEQETNKTPALTAERPVMYCQTSGTTGSPKNIPILKTTLQRLKRSQAIFSYAMYEMIPGIFSGKFLAINGAVMEGRLASGAPYGSMSGLIGESMPFSLKLKYVVPQRAFDVSDYNLKYLLIAAYALREKDITFFASANPTTFLKLLEIVKNNLASLLQFMQTGEPSRLPGAANQNINFVKGFTVDSERIGEIEGLMGRRDDLTLAALWPNLKGLATWTGGACSVVLPKLRAIIPESARIIELGYICSEFNGALTIDPIDNACLPTLGDNFFEFVKLEDGDNPSPKTLTLEQIEKGKQYYVIVTTQHGLYRYFINDIVEATGKFCETPVLRFVQKGKGITNLTGEKITESQVVEALKMIRNERRLTFDFFIMFADKDLFQYNLYIEIPPQAGLEKKLEEQLSFLNIEFEAKRKSGRLLPTRIIFVKEGCGDAYKAEQIAGGQRESQFKLIRLQYNTDCKFNFSPFMHPPP